MKKAVITYSERIDHESIEAWMVFCRKRLLDQDFDLDKPIAIEKSEDTMHWIYTQEDYMEDSSLKKDKRCIHQYELPDDEQAWVHEWEKRVCKICGDVKYITPIYE